jgi:hypothetical protein
LLKNSTAIQFFRVQYANASSQPTLEDFQTFIHSDAGESLWAIAASRSGIHKSRDPRYLVRGIASGVRSAYPSNSSPLADGATKPFTMKLYWDIQDERWVAGFQGNEYFLLLRTTPSIASSFLFFL